MDIDKFQPARLIPVSGIKGDQVQERHAASSLLAVMRVVPELAHVLLSSHGAPKGSVKTFIEPEFKVGSAKIRPDGLIIVERGKTKWQALVEFKTGKNDLELKQLNDYLDLCRDHKFDALVTISNQVLNASGQHPTLGIDARKLKSTKLIHLSWLRIITECLILSEHVGVDDIERDFILKELLRFLQSDQSGASEFNDMGPGWASVREDIKTGVLKKANDDVYELLQNFESLMRYVAFTLSARLGVQAREVNPKLASTDYKKHLSSSAAELIASKTLRGEIAIPGSAANLHVAADLASGLIRSKFTVAAPGQGRSSSRINWLTKQLGEVSGDVRVSWTYKRARASEPSVSLGALIDGNNDLVIDKSKEIAFFTIEQISKMGIKRQSGQGGFITSVVDSVESAYGELLQKIKPWQSPAPKLSKEILEIIPAQNSSLTDDPIS